MTYELAPGSVINALALLDHEPVPADQVREGAPATGLLSIDAGLGRPFGIWEITPGTSVDIEADETFVVLSGRASVRIDGGHVLELVPGSLARLGSGMHTEWVVHETLRKVYIWAQPTAEQTGDEE